MSDSKLWEAPAIVPELTYADVPRAVEWLVRVFGFRERRDARLSWAGGGRAWLEAGSSLFCVTDGGDSWGESVGGGVSGVVMKVYVQNVDEHFIRARREGAVIISEPEDGFWGGRIYRALDYEGHRWEISQSGRDLAADLWRLPSGVTRGVPE
jgi:uncharacterized glyoxalase superfamily protein PhnB